MLLIGYNLFFQGSISQQLTCMQLHKRAERIAQLLLAPPNSHGMAALSTGDHVALMFPPGIDLVAAFYGCLYAGCVPVPVRPPHARSLVATLPTVYKIVEVCFIQWCLSPNWVLRVWLENRSLWIQMLLMTM